MHIANSSSLQIRVSTVQLVELTVEVFEIVLQNTHSGTSYRYHTHSFLAFLGCKSINLASLALLRPVLGVPPTRRRNYLALRIH